MRDLELRTRPLTSLRDDFSYRSFYTNTSGKNSRVVSNGYWKTGQPVNPVWISKLVNRYVSRTRLAVKTNHRHHQHLLRLLSQSFRAHPPNHPLALLLDHTLRGILQQWQNYWIVTYLININPNRFSPWKLIPFQERTHKKKRLNTNRKAQPSQNTCSLTTDRPALYIVHLYKL